MTPIPKYLLKCNWDLGLWNWKKDIKLDEAQNKRNWRILGVAGKESVSKK